MAEIEDRSMCGVPYFIPLPSNDTASLVHDLVLFVVNVPFCIFAFLGNLAVIVAVMKHLACKHRPTFCYAVYALLIA